MSKEVTVIFRGELGIELTVDRASGAVRIKRAEDDSPAKPHEGAALRAINARPVGKIDGKAAWLELVERLKAPARPLVLTLEASAPAAPDRAAVDRARAELEALASSAKAAAEQAETAERAAAAERPRTREVEAEAAASAPAATRGRAFSRGGQRSRSPSPELTCVQCGRKGT